MTDATRRPIADHVAAAAAIVLAVLLLSRVVRYLPLPLPESLDAALGTALIGAWLLFIFPLLLLPWHLTIAALLAGAVCVRPRAGFVRAAGPGGSWQLRPWLHALVWAELVLNHALLDVNPHLALAVAIGFAGVALDARLAGARAGDRHYAIVVTLVFALWILRADTWADGAAGLLFAALLWWLLRGAKRVLGTRERRLAVLLAGAACQLVAAGLPILLPLHGGTPLGRGLAYSFCESPAAGKFFAAVPEAPTMLAWSLGGAHGRGGFVAMYDLPDLANEKRLTFFSADFYGRFEWVQCLDDRVYVGMTNTTWQGDTRQDHAMAFDIADPRSFEPDVTGGGTGHGIAYDRRRGALYFVSENRPAIVRLDLATGAREEVMQGVPAKKWFLSLVVGPTSVSAARDSLFLAEWFGGTHAYEVDLETQYVRHTYPHRDGGALGLAVDEEMRRLYVVGVWGMEVFDLDTEELVARRRLGLLPRSPAIDAKRGLVYVASTGDGRIRVFDRETLEPRGSIPIGFGPRIPLYSATDRLLASSAAATWWWDGDWLGERYDGER